MSMRILSRLVALSFTFALAAAGIFAQQELVTDRIDQGKRILQPEPISKKNASKEPTLNLISATTYTFASSSGAVLEDMSSGTTLLVGPSLDDNASVATPLGFTFVYDGVQFTQFSVNANGLLRLGGVVVSTGFTNSLASTTDAPKIAAYWEDLCTGSNGKVHFKTVGSAPNRKVVVEWQNMQVTRGAGCAGTGNGTFQATLFESTGSTTPGAIKFVYGAMGIPATADAGYSIGLQSGGATNFASVTSSASTVSYTTANNTNLTALDAGTSYTFSPNVPIAPTDAGTTNITPVSFQLNWLDNSTTETSYILQRSDEGINYQTIATLPANTTTYTDIGRAPNTPYFYRIQGVSEGAFGPFGSITATTSIPTEDSCVGSGGNWNTPGTWLDGSVPTATTNVTIGTGCTVTIDTAASAVNVNVQSGATLLFDSGTAQSLTAGYDVTIAAGGTLQTASSGSVTTHQLNVGRTLTNNGVLDLSTNSDTAGAVLQFNNPNRADFLGTGVTTDLLTLTVNKGTGLVNPQTGPVLDVVLSNMTVKGLSTATAGFLNLTTANGLLYFSGSNSFSGPVFQTAAYTIPSSFSFGVNNPNFTVTGQDGSPTLAGRLVVSQGVFNIGTSNGNSMGFNTGASVVVGNGTVNATGRFGVNVSTNVIGYTQTGGTVNVQTIGNASTTLAGFDLGTSAASTVSITGGDIVVQLASTAATTPRDYRNQAGTGTLGVTGGNLRLGNASSGAAKIFNILGVIANLFVTNTSAGHTALYGTPVTYNNVTRNITIDSGATLNPGNFVFLFNGTTLTNNGTLTHNGASSNFVTFNTVAPVLYTGTGSVTTPLTALALQSDQGFTIDPGANNFTATALRVFGGNFNGANKLTVGNGGATTAAVQFGNTTTPTLAGVLDSTPTFNPGTGGITFSYLRTGAARTVGPEIPASRTITSIAVDENDPTHPLTFAGGDVTVTGAMALTNGRVITDPGSKIIHNGAATRTTGFIEGPLARNITAAASYTYFVGGGGFFSPFTLNTTAVTTPGLFSAWAVDAPLVGLNPAISLSRNWMLTEAGDITATVSFVYNDSDVNGNEADYRLFRVNGPGLPENMCPVAPCVTAGTNTAGPLTAISDFGIAWSAGEPQAPPVTNLVFSGAVTSLGGFPLRNARVVLSGGDLAAPRTVYTNNFGNFAFYNLTQGQTYLYTPTAAKYTFTPAVRSINLGTSATNFAIVADQ